MQRIIRTPENPTASAGFEPANSGTEASMLNTRPPKSLKEGHNMATILVRKKTYMATVFFLSGFVLGMDLTMVSKQWPKLVADF